jgi:hypothetical protein
MTSRSRRRIPLESYREETTDLSEWIDRKKGKPVTHRTVREETRCCFCSRVMDKPWLAASRFASELHCLRCYQKKAEEERAVAQLLLPAGEVQSERQQT